jgi:hypothetical protein
MSENTPQNNNDAIVIKFKNRGGLVNSVIMGVIMLFLGGITVMPEYLRKQSVEGIELATGNINDFNQSVQHLASKEDTNKIVERLAKLEKETSIISEKVAAIEERESHGMGMMRLHLRELNGVDEIQDTFTEWWFNKWYSQIAGAQDACRFDMHKLKLELTSDELKVFCRSAFMPNLALSAMQLHKYTEELEVYNMVNEWYRSGWDDFLGAIEEPFRSAIIKKSLERIKS